MATLGFADLKQTSFPSLWDTAEILKARLADGSSLEAVVADLRGALREFNNSLLDMPHYADMFAVQDNPEVEYPVGSSDAFEEATEYSRPDPKRGETTGHTLPLKAYDRSLGWTMRYLRKARRSKLDADIRAVISNARDLWQKKLLTRLFSSAGNTVGTTSNADVPLADGGSVDSSWVPPVSPEGETFLYTHEHFLDYSDTGITQNTINQSAIDVALEHLQEHGHPSPFTLVGSRIDAAQFTAITGWKAPDWNGLAYHASAVERAAGVSDVGQYFGFIESDYGIVQVWLTPRVPTLHFAVYKSYGRGDDRNTLRVRIDPNVGFGFTVVDGNWVNAPELLAVVYTEFGVGIGQDRTNGVCVDVAASSYSSPTIS